MSVSLKKKEWLQMKIDYSDSQYYIVIKCIFIFNKSVISGSFRYKSISHFMLKYDKILLD